MDIFFTPNSSDLTATSDGTDPTALGAILAPLADNGGHTLTHGLAAGSPAIDQAGATCSGTDQRGVSRPQGAACDIGAFELGDAPTISINDVSSPEGNSGTRNLSFTIRLSASASGPVSVRYATADGIAAAGSDYNAKSGTVNFTAGQTTKTINIAIRGDTTVEFDETFFVNLSNPVSATIADASAAGVILNDDGPPRLPAISIGDISAAERNSGTSNFTFTVRLSEAAPGPISVRYATADGTAAAANDYDASSGTVSFAAGETAKTFNVAVRGDTTVEFDETFFVNLSSPVGATIADASAACVITNDDGPPRLPAISVADISAPEGNSGASGFVFTVRLTEPAPGPISVSYATGDGSARAGSDYTGQTGALNFAVGETMKTISVVVFGDTTLELDESFIIDLSDPSGATIANRFATAIITNDDTAPPLPTISINDIPAPERNSGTSNFTFTVRLSAPAPGPVSVNYIAVDGSAKAGSDYNAISGTVRFAASETTMPVSVVVRGDTTVEPDETFFVNLSGASGATIADASGTGTITNDDGDPSLPTISINDVIDDERNATFRPFVFTIRLSAPSSNPVSVSYATSNGSASAGSDYSSMTGTVSIPAGEMTQTVGIAVRGDALIEPDETFFVTLSSPSGATIGDASSTGTIANDDGAPTISINNVAEPELNSVTHGFNFTIRLSAAATGPVSVRYATANGSAAAGSDYNSSSGTVNFAAGEMTKLVFVGVRGDTVAEADETFFVNLSNPVGATISAGTGTGTITNDDLPTISITDVTANEPNRGNSNFRFVIFLSAPAMRTVSVRYATANGSAIAGSDYTARKDTISFAPGETEKPVGISVRGDTTVEPNERFFVDLSSPTGGTIGRGNGVGTIINDD